MDLATPQFWIAGLEIIVINILLSGDNAVVIALACRNLPRRQRRWGVFWGAIGAIVLRIILTFFAVQLLSLPYLKILGGALLLYIGVKLIVEEDDADPNVKASDRMLAAIRTVIVADLVMSVDNVLAVAAAAKGSLWLLVFGLAVSIPLVIVGAQLIMRLIDRFPLLILGGGGASLCVSTKRCGKTCSPSCAEPSIVGRKYGQKSVPICKRLPQCCLWPIFMLKTLGRGEIRKAA